MPTGTTPAMFPPRASRPGFICRDFRRNHNPERVLTIVIEVGHSAHKSSWPQKAESFERRATVGIRGGLGLDPELPFFGFARPARTHCLLPMFPPPAMAALGGVLGWPEQKVCLPTARLSWESVPFTFYRCQRQQPGCTMYDLSRARPMHLSQPQQRVRESGQRRRK